MEDSIDRQDNCGDYRLLDLDGNIKDRDYEWVTLDDGTTGMQQLLFPND